MAPKYYLYSDFTVDDALERAGCPPSNDQYLANEPPVSFFEQPPKDCAAIFSTYNGQIPFRFVNSPTYEREGSYWWAAQIQKTCDGLRRNMPDVCRNIEHPRDYWDLYKYFDALDIYERGARNLFSVIATLVWENNYAQQCVEREQRAQTEQHTPLFEVLSAKMMRKQGNWHKLSKWNEEKQPDILQVFPMHELVSSFADFDRYPEHFRQVIRVIMRKHYDITQVVNPLATGSYNMTIPTINVRDRLDALRFHLEQAPDDPFMDKFDIPNKIVNGVVVVDGTSQTAARKAGHNRSSMGSTHDPKKHEDAPTENNDPSRENTEANCLAAVSETMRCSSAPRMGPSPSKSSEVVGTHQPRVHTSNGFKAAVNPIVSPIYHKCAVSEPPIAVDTVDVAHPAGYAPNGHLQQHPPLMHNVLPSHPGIRRPSHHQDLSVQHRATLPPVFIPGSVAPGAPFPDHQDRGIPQGAFVHQIPTYAISQQHIQGPPPMMQQGHFSAPAHSRTNGGGGNMSSTPPYVQAQVRPAFSDCLGSSAQKNKSFSSQSNGKWHQVGSDNIHGPKVIYRKDSVNDQIYNINGSNQWQGKDPHHADRRTSTTSNAAGYRRFSNNRSQNHNSYAGPHTAETRVGTTGYKSRTSTSTSQLLRDYGCANAKKIATLDTKFDACPCAKCSDRDQTIYVHRFEEGVLQTTGAEDRLRQHFKKFGEVRSVDFLEHLRKSVYIRFVNSQSTVDAVRLEPRAHIKGLGNRPVSVDFRTGSQFFTPKPPKHLQGSGDYGYFAQNPAQVQHPMKPQPLISPNNINGHAQPLQQHLELRNHLPRTPVATQCAIVHPGHHASLSVAADRALDVIGRRASQSGFGKKEYVRRNSANASKNGLSLSPWETVTENTGSTCESRVSVIGSELDGTAEISAENARPLTQKSPMSRRTSQSNTIKTPHSTGSTPQAALPLASRMAEPIERSEDDGILSSNKEIDHGNGTVRVRPEKAKYVPIDSDSQRNGFPHHSQNDNQKVPVTTGAITAKLPLERYEKQSSPEHETLANEQSALSSLGKRKASQPHECEEATSRLSPKEPAAKVPRPNEPVPGHQIEQPGNQEEQIAAQTTSGKKRKNKKNKNKRHQSQEAVPTNPAASSSTYQAKTFQPVLSAPALTPYADQITPNMGFEVSNTWAHMQASTQGMHPLPTSAFPGHSEPFPPYEDTMSGPQPATYEHQRNDSKWSFSSDEAVPTPSTVGKSKPLNPGARNFVPSPARTVAAESVVTTNDNTPTTPQSIPPVNIDRGAGDGKDDDGARKLTTKEHGWGRSNSGSKPYQNANGKRKYNNKKNQRQSVNVQPPIGTPRADTPLNASQPNRSGGALVSKNIPVPAEHKVESPKPEMLRNEPGPSMNPQPKELSFPVSGNPEVEGKGKGKEVVDLESKLKTVLVIRAESDDDKKNTEAETNKAPEQGKERSPPPNAPQQTSSQESLNVSSSSNVATPATTTAPAAPAVPNSNKSKQNKKNRQSQNKGTGTGTGNLHPTQANESNNNKNGGQQAPQQQQPKQPMQAGKAAAPGAWKPASNNPAAAAVAAAATPKQILKLDSADDFPALPPKPAPTLAPIPLVAFPRHGSLGLNQKNGCARSTPSTSATSPTSPASAAASAPVVKNGKGKGKDKIEGGGENGSGNGNGGRENGKGKEKEKVTVALPPVKGERKGG